MIHTVSGDILLTKAQAIAHGVGPDDHFTNGLALALREQWPSMPKDFRHWSHLNHPKPGAVWMWGGVGNHRIFCLLTQDPTGTHGHGGHGSHPGRATVEHVNHCLRELRHQLERERITSLAIPRLACGVGGLTWAQVEPLIRHHLDGLDIPIFLYADYRKGIAAAEPGSATAAAR